MLAQTVFVSKPIDFFIGNIFFEREKEGEKERERVNLVERSFLYFICICT